jgi:hypothetical protein
MVGKLNGLMVVVVAIAPRGCRPRRRTGPPRRIRELVGQLNQLRTGDDRDGRGG